MGRGVAADCPQARAHTFIVWPRPLEPWLPPAERRSARLPSASDHCPPLQGSDAAPLMLSGVRDGAVIRQIAVPENVTLPVSTTGGKGRRWWF